METSGEYQALRRGSRRWRWYGVAFFGGVVAVAYVATGLAPHYENVQLAGGIVIIVLVLGAIYCFAKAGAKASSAWAARPHKNQPRPLGHSTARLARAKPSLGWRLHLCHMQFAAGFWPCAQRPGGGVS